MRPPGTLLLNRDDVARLLSMPEYLEIVEAAFRSHAEHRILSPGLLHIDAATGEFHIKAGGVELERPYFALKANSGFFRDGAERLGVPAIQGVILLCDARSGYPLALMDSIEITLGRTGATTALAARYLARPDSRTVTVCGCGNQGRTQLRFLKQVCPIETAFAFDIDERNAQRFASAMAEELSIAVSAVSDLGKAVRASDVCIACTPSRQAYLRAADVPAGSFIAAVGADSPDKQELDPRILTSATLVVDLLEQCASVGELHHGLESGLLSLDGVHGELSEVIAGAKPGRTSEEEVIVFDATGTAFQDAAAAAAAYTKAVARKEGVSFDFFRRAEM